MTPSYARGASTALCLINWDPKMPIIDDGSYENWLEGTRILTSAIKAVPLQTTRVATFLSDTAAKAPAETIAGFLAADIRQALVAGNFIEEDVVGFVMALIEAGIEPVVLFDVCGTKDPMAKWQSLATMVDSGAKMSTVQQTLKQISGEIDDLRIRSHLLAILHEGMGEHAVELSAA